MHFALLIGYGASAVNPYLALEALEDLARRGYLPEGVTAEIATRNFIKAINKGLLKTFSKMGISTLQSYRGAQVFEAIGLNKELVDKYFVGTTSQLEGVGLDVLAREAQMKHEHAFRPVSESEPELSVGGSYHFRTDGEYHLLNPLTISKLQHAVRAVQLQDLSGIHGSHRQPEPQPRDFAQLDEDQEGRGANRDRRSRAGERDCEALHHRRDVIRFDQQRSSRNAGHRHEPDRRKVEHRRRRRR